MCVCGHCLPDGVDKESNPGRVDEGGDEDTHGDTCAHENDDEEEEREHISQLEVARETA